MVDPTPTTRRRDDLERLLSQHRPADAREAGFLERMQGLLRGPGDPFSRDHFTPGHFTASAFVLSPERDAILLVLHGKLGRWLQPGGHVDPEDATVLDAARRELLEEVGVGDLSLLPGHEALFDVDVHTIPARKSDPDHEHHDLRFLFMARDRGFTAGSDAKAARWVRLEDVQLAESDASVMRAVEKIVALVRPARPVR